MRYDEKQAVAKTQQVVQTPAPQPVQQNPEPTQSQAVPVQPPAPVAQQQVYKTNPQPTNPPTHKGTFMNQDQTQNTAKKPSLIRGGIASPIGRNNSSAAMDNIRKALDEIGATNDWKDYQVKYLEMDTAGAKRRVAAMVVAARCTAVADSPIAYHAVLLEETGDRQIAKRRYENINYEDELYPSDGYDSLMREEVIRRVAAEFMPGAPIHYDQTTGITTIGNVQLLDAMASTIPSTVNLKEIAQVRGPMANASIAVITLLDQALGRTVDLKLEGNVAGQRWTANVLASTASFTDMTGTPTRGSLVVELREGGSDNSNNNNWNASYNDPNGEQLTHQVLGFMDMIYDPTMAADQLKNGQGMFGGFNPMMAMGGMMPGMGMNPEAYQVMRARYVITHLDAIYNPTLPDILFGLAAANEAVLEGGRWKQALISQHNNGADELVNGRNLRDLGILGTEVIRPGIGEQAGQMVKARFGTTGGRGEDPALFNILQTCFRPEPVLSMHVPESGAFSWMSGYFLTAAMGNPASQSDIIGAADYMTRNNFSQIFNRLTQGTQPRIVINDNLLVNLGRYTDPVNGMLRDSREVDTAVVMNVFAEQNPAMVDRWIRTQNDSSLPMEFRLSEQRAIIREMYNNVQFTGRARSITFDPLFIRALCEAIAACGGRIHLRNGNENPQNTNRVTAQFLSGTRYATGQSGMQAMSQYVAPAGQHTGQYQWGRWVVPTFQ